MSNTVLKCHAYITKIAINGSGDLVPDASGFITVTSVDATEIMRGAELLGGHGPITVAKVPTDPTT